MAIDNLKFLWSRNEVDPEGAARAIAQLLAPGGELLMLTGNAEEPMNLVWIGQVISSYPAIFYKS